MVRVSPASRVRWKWWAPTGAQPWAMLLEQRPALTASGGAAVYAAEGVAGGVEAGDRGVGPEHCVVVAALAVLGLVVDGAAHDLHFAGGEVALEVGAVVHGVPQAELHVAEHIQRAGGAGLVFQR